jgi:transcription termination/antitermination protein NusG
MNENLPPTDDSAPEPPPAPAPAAERPDEPVAAAPAELPAAPAPAPEPAAAEARGPGGNGVAGPAAEAPAEPAADAKKWYIVKVQSNREESIKAALERRAKVEGLEHFLGRIIIPTERVTEVVKGKRVIKERKKFPGYLMVECDYNDQVLYLFRETSGVGDFVGGSLHRPPPPMPDREVERMLAEQHILEHGKPEESAREIVKINFEVGDKVRVRDGTFAGMEGEVREIIQPREAGDTVRVRVELTIFGRPVPVELEYWQVDTV